MLVHIIADYGMGDLAFAEVVQRIKIHLPDMEPVLTPVPAFSTIAAGFCIAQIGLHPSPPGTLIYHNVARGKTIPLPVRKTPANVSLTHACQPASA